MSHPMPSQQVPSWSVTDDDQHSITLTIGTSSYCLPKAVAQLMGRALLARSSSTPNEQKAANDEKS